MIKKLVRHGNSLALVLDKPVLELLKISEDTPLEIGTSDGKTLHITPLAGGDALKAKLDSVNRNESSFRGWKQAGGHRIGVGVFGNERAGT